MRLENGMVWTLFITLFIKALFVKVSETNGSIRKLLNDIRKDATKIDSIRIYPLYEKLEERYFNGNVSKEAGDLYKLVSEDEGMDARALRAKAKRKEKEKKKIFENAKKLLINHISRIGSHKEAIKGFEKIFI
jgi:hypothetical protein